MTRFPPVYAIARSQAGIPPHDPPGIVVELGGESLVVAVVVVLLLVVDET